MKLSHFILIFAIFAFMLPQVQANNFVDITLHWLKAVGDAEDCNEPIFGDWVYSAEESKYISKLLASHKFSENSFTRFLKETGFVEEYTYSAVGASAKDDTSMLLEQHPPVIDTKKLPRDLIAKVLDRRTPLLNIFEFDKTMFENTSFDSKYFCRANSRGAISYLDFVWQRLLIMIVLSNDLRFEREVNNLMSYLMTPNQSTSMWDENDKLLHARLTCGGGPISRVKNICIGYLNLFRITRGLSSIGTENHAEWTGFEWSQYRAK